VVGGEIFLEGFELHATRLSCLVQTRAVPPPV
jgi:hypothetical protein